MSSAYEAGVLPAVPLPQLRTVENTTGFPHLAFDKMGKGRLFHDVVVCKATFTLAPGILRPAGQAMPIALADRYWNEETAHTSSLKVAGDVLLAKRGADIVVTGSARTFDGKPRTEWHAGVRVSRHGRCLAEHRMRLLGPRAWRHQLLWGWSLTETVATDNVPLRHELAYGGHYPVPHPKPGEEPINVFGANPAGLGYWDAGQLDKTVAHAAPQIETLDMPITAIGGTYPLAAPAPLARFWSDRVRHGGTYDDAWHRQFHASAIPDFPHDFDTRFFQCAHPNLICGQSLHGDELLNLVGLVPGPQEVLVCQLPEIRIQADLTAADGRVGQQSLALDTLHIDLDAQVVALTWRLTLDQRACIERVRLTQVSTRAQEAAA